MFHGAVQSRGEEKAYADLADATADRIGAETEIHAQGLQNIGAAALAGDGTVAVLGHRHPGPGHDKGRGRGDVEGAGGVAAGAAGVHQHPVIGKDRDRGGLFPHDHGRAADLGYGLALDPQGGEKSGDLGRGGLAAHDLLHDRDHLLFREIAADNQTGNGFPNHGVISFLCLASSSG